MVTGAFTMILRSLKEDVSAEVFSLAYAADHLHHNKIIVKPLVEDSKEHILVIERSLLTTLIYQSQMLGADLKWLGEINKYVEYIPNLSIILRVERDELMKRKEVEKKQFDKFETTEMLGKQLDLYADIPEDLKQKYNVQYVDVNGKGVQGVVEEIKQKVKEMKKC
jgi:thymidylate kinase